METTLQKKPQAKKHKNKLNKTKNKQKDIQKLLNLS